MLPVQSGVSISNATAHVAEGSGDNVKKKWHWCVTCRKQPVVPVSSSNDCDLVVREEGVVM